MTSGLVSNSIGVEAGGGTPTWLGCEWVKVGRAGGCCCAVVVAAGGSASELATVFLFASTQS